MQKPPENSLSPYLWMLSGNVAFALMAAIASVVGQSCDWRVVALTRAGLACLFAIVMARAAGAQLVFWKPRILWIRSFAGSASLLCTFYSLTRLDLPVSEVLTITNIFPVWVAILSWPVLGEVPSLGVWASVLSGVAGVALIQQPHFAAGRFAVLVPVAASLCTAVAMMGLHQLHGVDARAIVAHFSGVAAVCCLVALLIGRPDRSIEAAFTGYTPLQLVGVGASATLGQLCLTHAFASGVPAKVSIVGLTQIIFSLAIDVTVFRVSFDLTQPATQVKVVGMALILVPTAAMMLRHRGEPAPE
jgi:drug/metabolite transporter (DMT)-like permease